MHKVIPTFLLFIAIAFLFSSCIVIESPCPTPANQTQQSSQNLQGQFELFSTVPEYPGGVLMLLDQNKITADQVTVDGIKLGDTFQRMVDLAGYPQIIDEFYDDGIINAKYEDNATNTEKIFHLENDTITRIVIRGGANNRLPAASQVSGTLYNITSRFGKPDFAEDVTLANSGYRVYYYYPLGLEIYHKRKQMVGYAFVMPREAMLTLKWNATEDDQVSPEEIAAN